MSLFRTTTSPNNTAPTAEANMVAYIAKQINSDPEAFNIRTVVEAPLVEAVSESEQRIIDTQTANAKSIMDGITGSGYTQGGGE